MDRTTPNSDLTGLFNVGRRSIRRLAHAVKKKRESAAAEASDVPVRGPTGNPAASSERKSNSRLKKTSKKYAFPTLTEEQEQTTSRLTVQPVAAVEREAARRGVARRSSSRTSSRPATSKTKAKALVSWPFKRSQGRLDIKGRPLHNTSLALTKVTSDGRRKARVRTGSIAAKTSPKATHGRDTRQEGPTAGDCGQQASRSTSGEGDEESTHRRFKKRRRRRSLSDADDNRSRGKASRQTRVVAAGLATPRRPRVKEQDRRCTPKKLNVKGEEFLSLKKKLEWELTLGLYCRQKKEFMEINKDMYE